MVRIRPPPPRKTAIRKDGGFFVVEERVDEFEDPKCDSPVDCRLPPARRWQHLYFHSPKGMKMQTNPSSPTRKNPLAKQADFFSYIRLTASSIAPQCYWLAPVILGSAQFNGEYNITSAQAEISLSRQAQYHYEVISLKISHSALVPDCFGCICLAILSEVWYNPFRRIPL